MADPIELNGPAVPPSTGAAPDTLVVLLHGVGADGNDLIALAPYLQRVLPGALIVSPDAPWPCDMAPMGRQWFSLQDRSETALLEGVRSAAPLLDGFLTETLARFGLGPERLALVGFSQGTMTALHTALRRPDPIAGIVGFSGHLIGAEVLPEEITARPPVLLVHGEADEVVPVAALDHAVATLQANEVPVRGERRPDLPHSIDDEGLALAMAFLSEQLGGTVQPHPQG